MGCPAEVARVRISALVGGRTHEVTVDLDEGRYLVRIDGVPHHVDAHKLEGDFYSFLCGGRSYEVSVEPGRDGYRVRHGAAEVLVEITDPGRSARRALAASQGPARIVSPMPGRVVRLLVAVGDRVEAGQGVVVVEAMKMENEMGATKAGTVRSIEVEPGQTVESGAVLAEID
jgi:biotin carboxyl carrier protein